MKSDPKSARARSAWPFDLLVFGVLAGLWALCLATMAFVQVGEFEVIDPIKTIFAGVRFDGDDARLVLIVESGIFAMIALGVLTRRRWGLLLALCYMAQVVMSHLAFVIAYLPIQSEWIAVRAVASQGPMVVLITLYLWIRGYDLIFDSPPADTRPDKSMGVSNRVPVRAESSAANVAAIAD